MSKSRKSSLPAAASPGATSVAHRFGDAVVTVDAIYHVKEIAPKAPGPWSREAEKVAWTDPTTGYGCIIRRAAQGGHLCGYVGVGPGHPLYGYQASACRNVGIRAHGGISYAKECERHEQEKIARPARYEERSVCHVVKVSDATFSTTKEGRTILDVQPHDDLWWIGFECNQPTDIIPDGSQARGRPGAPAGTAERTYRDEAYVFGQCLWLADQLKAIAQGRDLAEVTERWTPALGYDPRNAERCHEDAHQHRSRAPLGLLAPHDRRA